MSANVETMAYTGETPWHGLGTYIDHAMTSQEALIAAGLDWNVTSEEVVVRGQPVPGIRANVRSTDGAILGVVGSRYKIIQNSEAFAFTDFLLKNDAGVPVTYETAGSLDHGRKVWLLARLPEQLILGDAIVPYIVFVNSHDGKGSVKVAMVPTRVVCQNTLNLALQQASRTWSTKHLSNIHDKMLDAADTLQLATAYMRSLEEKAETLEQIRFSKQRVEDFVNELFPVPANASQRHKSLILQKQDDLKAILFNKEDLKSFRETAWGAYSAVADYESHLAPKRFSKSFKEKRFEKFIYGNEVLVRAEEILLAA